MTDKTLNYPKLAEHLNSKWSLWYTDDEMLLKAPPHAPDWVKKCWVPVPKDYHFNGTSKSIDCSPHGGVQFVGGPKDGTIAPNYPGPGGNEPTLLAYSTLSGVSKVVGTYDLMKEGFSYSGVHYHRSVYVFKSNEEDYADYHKELGAKFLNKSPKSALVDKVSSFEDKWLKYDKDYVTTPFSNGTHTGIMNFEVQSVSPEMLKIMYGGQDPWGPKTEEIEEEETTLWDAI